jgi:hypothetical protein
MANAWWAYARAGCSARSKTAATESNLGVKKTWRATV